MDRKTLQGIADRQRESRARVQRACPGFCPTASDNGVTHQAGMRVVDQITGEIVEVIDARQFPSFDRAARSSAS